MTCLFTWAFALLTVIAPVAVTALYIHLFCAGTFRRATRPWAEAAAFAGSSRYWPSPGGCGRRPPGT